VNEPQHRQATRRGHGGVRALGWLIGIVTILGTAALVIIAVIVPGQHQVVRAMKPARVCPPVVSIPARGLGMPVDEVMGVRPGMNARDVEETVKCVSEDYMIAPINYRSPANGGRKTRRALQVKRGPETMTFAMFGVPGQEQVAGAWREVYFDVGSGPSLMEVEGMFTAQYGPPHEARVTPTGERVLQWTYAPDGRALRVRPRDGDIAGGITYMTAGFTVAACVGNARIDPAMPPAWDGRCGLTIRAEIDPMLSDRARTARWRIVLLDQATLARQAAPLRALSSQAAP